MEDKSDEEKGREIMKSGDKGPDRSDPEREVADLLRLAGPRAAVDPARAGRVEAAVRDKWRQAIHARRSRKIFWLVLPAGAAALLMVAVGLIRWNSGRERLDRARVATLVRIEEPLRLEGRGNLTSGARVRMGEVLSTGAGGKAALQFSSAASVRLDSDTTLRLLSQDTLELRNGAVYIDSRDQEMRRFLVKTPYGTVRDVGTQFEVRLGEADLRVTVREGRAALGSSTGDLAVEAGVRLRVGTNGEISRSEVRADGPEWDWVQSVAPPMQLEGKTLGDFLAWVARETGHPIRFADPSAAAKLSSIVLHGSVEGLRPDQAPDAVLPTCGLTSRLEGSVLMILPVGSGKESR